MDVARYLRSRGGFANRATLVSAAVSDDQLSRQTQAGLILRLRQGWYADADADANAMAAVAAGGRLSCSSALRFHGAWTLDDRLLHVSCPRGRGLRAPGMKVHTAALRSRGLDVAVESPLEALTRLARCGSRHAFIAAADSALHTGLVSSLQLESAIATSVRGRALMEAVDARSESGIESLARLAFRRYGVQFTPQVEIDGVGRVDLLVGHRMVVELDSWTWHSDRQAFERDRRRDLALAARGYLPIRISYRRVLEDWPAVQADLLAIVRAGEHRRDPRGLKDARGS